MTMFLITLNKYEVRCNIIYQFVGSVMCRQWTSGRWE